MDHATISKGPTLGRRDIMSQLAEQFPTLQREAPITPFDPDALDAFACSGACSSAILAAQFVLSVWVGSCGAADIHARKAADRRWLFKCRRFDLQRALMTWDDEHRAAFVAWATNPWWP